jgi:hypothetical protein
MRRFGAIERSRFFLRGTGFRPDSSHLVGARQFIVPLLTKDEPSHAGLQTLTEKLNDCKGAIERARQLQTEREEAYGRAFDALIAEQSVLEELYGPLMARLAAASGMLLKSCRSQSRASRTSISGRQKRKKG